MQRIALGTAFLFVATSTLAQSPALPHPGRLLASNCFQCHGTNGRSQTDIERLVGKSASEIYSELREMRLKNEHPNSIMTKHANGYTDAQLRLIADFFATQR